MQFRPAEERCRKLWEAKAATATAVVVVVVSFVRNKSSPRPHFDFESQPRLFSRIQEGQAKILVELHEQKHTHGNRHRPQALFNFAIQNL